MKKPNQWYQYHTVLLASVLIFFGFSVGLIVYDYKPAPAKRPTNSHASVVPSPTSVFAPTASPTLTPTITPTPTIGPPDQFNGLPGFTMAYSSDWTVTQKKFGIKDPGVFVSRYFPSCHQACMGIRFSKGDISVDLIFDKAYDSAGMKCSNSASYQELSGGWYRVKDSTGYFYTTMATVDVTTEGKKDANDSASLPEWGVASGTHYAICTIGAGTFLNRNDLPGQGDNYEGAGILLEFPRVHGNPNTAQLTEIDAIITSIRGIKNY